MRRTFRAEMPGMLRPDYGLGNGDEVITNGGVAGVVREIGEHFITIEVADNVRLRVQRGAIANVLPKGTLKSA